MSEVVNIDPEKEPIPASWVPRVITGGKEPPMGSGPVNDWLTYMNPRHPDTGGEITGTEFVCRNKTGNPQPRWAGLWYTHCGHINGCVLLAPTVFLDDPKQWFWVADPKEFCRIFECVNIIEYPPVPPKEE